ncbi:hypothetical protein WPS_04910 [Vulcanimicrobium alpinum]|uniref:DUF998 domain-containing protein n=1 Tax=Vulcanimicrobium alpinum TaxID=3016050 RepID=A0AAN1XUB8_UNVUL|nr:hypothetical protein [Vulcanimicrobium alpinum]BDE05215.1 hypothetical protein WPS_04910 [Vulcanimicrobium alpinum]
MIYRIAERSRGTFAFVMAMCAAFFVLTIAAMLLYPGGSLVQRNGTGYAFFENFFSDLGQTHTHSGASNLPSLVLFTIALNALAIGLAIFFVGFTRLFTESGRAILLARIAAFAGVISAVSFAGVAFTPWNLYLRAHNEFVTWAFRSFLLAVVLMIVAIAIERGFPKRFAWVFAAFAVVLAAYVALLAFGPTLATPQGAKIQVTGQKIIAYTSVATIFVQAWMARALSP